VSLLSRSVLMAIGLIAATTMSYAQLTDPNGAVFSFLPPGDLKPDTGRGSVDDTNYIPGMRFPIEEAPAYANTQKFAGGGNCGMANFRYPWRDDYCERRPKKQTSSTCPAYSGVHQGQDIRAKTCEKDLHWAVAAVDGHVAFDNPQGPVSTLEIFSTSEHFKLRYLHMSDKDADRPKKLNDPVARGDQVGKVGKIARTDDCGGIYSDFCTTTHLHFEIFTAVRATNGARTGWRRRPPYRTLVDAYERLLKGQP